MQELLAGIDPPVNLTDCAVGRVTVCVPLVQVVARLPSLTAVKFALGKVSVMVAFVRAVEELFSRVMVSRLFVAPSLGIVFGVNVLETVTPELTVTPTLTVFVLDAPCVVVKSPGLMVLVYVPVAVMGALTSTVSAQDELARMVPPVNVTVCGAVMVGIPPVQVVPRLASLT